MVQQILWKAPTVDETTDGRDQNMQISCQTSKHEKVDDEYTIDGNAGSNTHISASSYIPGSVDVHDDTPDVVETGPRRLLPERWLNEWDLMMDGRWTYLSA